MPKVSFEMESVTVEVPAGATVYEAARKAGIATRRGLSEVAGCDGNGFCPGVGCAVFIRSPDAQAVNAPTWKEWLLHRKLYKNKKRLACQCVPQRDITVVTVA